MGPRTTFLLAGLGLLVAGVLGVATAGGGEVTPDPLAPAGAFTAEPAAAPVRRTAGPADSGRTAVAAPLRARALCGRAVDSGHAPLSGVHVALLLDGSPPRSTRTGADGAFVLALMPGDPTALTLFLQATGHAPAALGAAADIDAPPVDLGDIVLGRGGTVTGSVLGDGSHPRTDAQVRLRPVHGALLRLPGAVLDELLPALGVNGAGRFAFAALPEGAYSLEATAPGRQSRQVLPVPVRDGATTSLPAIALLPGHTLRGAVFDPAGLPLAGAWVDLAVAGSHAVGRLRRAQTDAVGAFCFDHLAPGPHHLRVAHEGVLTWERRDLDPRLEAHIDVRLERGATLRGRVRDAATGREIRDFRVRLQRADDPRDLAAAPAEERRAQRFERLSATAATLQRAAAEPRELTAALQELAAQETQRRAQQIAAWPFGPEPQRVWAPGPDHAGAAAGSFEFPGLADGLWLVEVAVPGQPPARIGPVLVRAGAGPTEVEVAVPGR